MMIRPCHFKFFYFVFTEITVLDSFRPRVFLKIVYHSCAYIQRKIQTKKVNDSLPQASPLSEAPLCLGTLTSVFVHMVLSALGHQGHRRCSMS